MTELLRALAARLGPAPRMLDEDLERTLALPSPAPRLGRGDSLARVRRDHDRLVRQGRLAAGVVFMANEGESAGRLSFVASGIFSSSYISQYLRGTTKGK